MKKFKNALLMSLAATTVLTTPIFAQTSNKTFKNQQNDVEFYGFQDEGVIINDYFSQTGTLSKDDGGTVNFYVENYSNNSIIIDINGTTSRTLQPGESGHISEEVTGTSQKFTFTAKPSGNNGGSLHISYIIKQRKG